MLRGFRDERDLTLGGLEQALLDSCQSGLDIGFESLVPHAQPERPDDGHEGLLSADALKGGLCALLVLLLLLWALFVFCVSCVL
ncbi:hypothetical protein GCM10010307_38550 [Streptomyces vastus]|uniref:Uncharacterized protein n=1 Tax=Streptomyces vastus TaxID=285451 RepID=A0ABN3QZZ2_9ACTN